MTQPHSSDLRERVLRAHLAGEPQQGWMDPGLSGTFETPYDVAEAGIEYVANEPMDGRPFDIRTKRGTLASIPDTVELNDIPMTFIQHHRAAQ